MNSIVRLSRFPTSALIRRSLQVSANVKASKPSLGSADPTQKIEGAHPTPMEIDNIDISRYDIPMRHATMEDAMEPYGSYDIAYGREIRAANGRIITGIIAFTLSWVFFYEAGCIDALIMPNLDNIMEETVPWNFDKEGRKTV